MKLFQYWNDPVPPDDVASWIDGFRTTNPELDHILLDWNTALDFISRHYGAAEVTAFQACGQPAMQADYVRLCLMEAVGGIYLDADQQPLEPLASMIAEAPVALAPRWSAITGNGVLIFRKPHNPSSAPA